MYSTLADIIRIPKPNKKTQLQKQSLHWHSLIWYAHNTKSNRLQLKATISINTHCSPLMDTGMAFKKQISTQYQTKAVVSYRSVLSFTFFNIFTNKPHKHTELVIYAYITGTVNNSHNKRLRVWRNWEIIIWTLFWSCRVSY